MSSHLGFLKRMLLFEFPKGMDRPPAWIGPIDR
jgi:hypothetical protein